jgi:hypothetical protein
MNRGATGGGDRPRRSDTRSAPRRDENQRPFREPPADSNAQKVLIADPAAPGISLTSILPKKDSQPRNQATEVPKNTEQRTDTHPHSGDTQSRDGNKISSPPRPTRQADSSVETSKPFTGSHIENTRPKQAHPSASPSHQAQKQATSSKSLPNTPPPLPPRPPQFSAASSKPLQPSSTPPMLAGSEQSTSAHE